MFLQREALEWRRAGRLEEAAGVPTKSGPDADYLEAVERDALESAQRAAVRAWTEAQAATRIAVEALPALQERTLQASAPQEFLRPVTPGPDAPRKLIFRELALRPLE